MRQKAWTEPRSLVHVYSLYGRGSPMPFRSIFLAIVLAFAPAAASAQVTLFVNLRIDVPDPDTSDGLCGIRWRGIMRCSLRAAIQEAS